MPIRLGMLGMWHTHADGIVRQVVAHPDEFRLVGFYDSDPDVVAARRKTWGTTVADFRVFDRPEDLLRQELDGVVVEGQVFDNLRLAMLALERGHSVMLEKPAGESLDEFRRLIDLAQRTHRHLQMIYLFRYMSAVVELFNRARRGDLGQVYEFRARLPKDLPSYDRYVRELSRYKGGIFFEMAGHVIDLMVAILGRPSSVTPFLAHHHNEPGTFVDNGIAVFGFQNAWGVVEVPALEVAPHSRRIEVYGTRGACVIPHLGSGHLANKDVQPIEVYRESHRDWRQIELPAATLQISDLREFAACIAGKKAPDYSAEHDLNVQETLLRSCGIL
jgi:predicted dehydrogenase